MLTYTIKRLLIMIPTFFAISLVIFIIINVAPGRPGEQMSTESSEEASGSRREAWRIFKSQFNLDKPILLNTRFSLERETVIKSLRTAAIRGDPRRRAEQIRAREWLEDCGPYVVPHLLDIAKSDKHPDIAFLAVKTLSENAQRKIRHEYGRRPDAETSAYNRQVYSENAILRQLTFARGASPADRARVLAAWDSWFNTVQNERFTYGFWGKVRIFFLDTRFAYYWWNLLRLDFGISHVDKQPVLGKVLSKLKYSLTLALPSLIISYLISIPLGIFAAVRRNSMADKTISVLLFMLYALPNFFVGTLLLSFFSEGSDYWHWFPTGGWRSVDGDQMTLLKQIKDVMWHLVLPLAAMSYVSLAALSRYARTGILEVINADYIRTARAKGLPESLVILKHTVRNGMIPVITLLGTVLPILIGGSVIIEVIFSIPGMGLLTYDAIKSRDYNIIMAVELITAVLVMLGVLLSDIAYALVDPRITYK